MERPSPDNTMADCSTGSSSKVRYTGFRDRPMDERQIRFQAETREGHADIAFVCTGTNLQLNFVRNAWSDRAEDRIPTLEFVNFDVEPGKVHLKSQFILNGVCVVWRGWVDLERLDGVGCLEFDEERAEIEDALLREQIEQNNRRVQEFEERRRQRQQEQERQAASEAEARSRRKSRPRKDVYAINTTSKSSSNTITAITTITSAITSSSSTALKKLEALTVVSEPKSSVCKPELPSLADSHHRPTLKDKEELQEDEEETEVDVVEVEADVEMEVEVRAVIEIEAEAEVGVQPRDKIRKSDTIWSPWK